MTWLLLSRRSKFLRRCLLHQTNHSLQSSIAINRKKKDDVRNSPKRDYHRNPLTTAGEVAHQIQVRFQAMVLSHLQPPFHRHPPQPRSFQPTIHIIQPCGVPPFQLPTNKDRSPAIRIRLLSLDPEIEERSLVAGRLNSIRDPSDFIGSCSIGDQMGVIGSANGLFCLSEGFEYVLCNPCIQKAIYLPRPNIGCRGWGYESLGFGYDPKTDDYKVVRLLDVKGATHSLVEIYTLRTGAWQSCTASGPPYLIDFDDTDALHNVFFNGAVHWPARTPENQSPFRNLIVLFDMEDEVFREMAMPKSLQDADYFDFFMAVVDGLLALIPYGDDDDMPVWVMKEYGRVESWTKQFDIKFEYGPYDPIGFRKNGEVLVNHDGHLCSYERNSERSWNLHVYEITWWFYFDTYVESLALMNVADGVLGVKVSSFCVSKLKEKEKKRKRKTQMLGQM